MQSQTPFLCLIEDKTIKQLDYAGRPVKEIGVTMEHYQDALSVIESYKNKLIEAGILKKEKTPQELYEEQMETMRQMMAELKNLNKRMDNYEHTSAIASDTDTHSAEKTGNV